MKLSNGYIPINCSFYDRLESWVTCKDIVRINYSIENKNFETSGCISDLYIREKAEYLLMDNGTEIRLDWINSVNNYPVPYQC